MANMETDREKVLQDYRKKLLEHKEVESRLKESKCYIIGYVNLSSHPDDLELKRKYLILVREQLKDLTKQYDKSENDLKALQSVGQIVGEVLKQLTEEKCKCSTTYFLY